MVELIAMAMNLHPVNNILGDGGVAHVHKINGSYITEGLAPANNIVSDGGVTHTEEGDTSACDLMPTGNCVIDVPGLGGVAAVHHGPNTPDSAPAENCVGSEGGVAHIY